MEFRTDMAVERRDLYKNANKIENEISGIESVSIVYCELNALAPKYRVI